MKIVIIIGDCSRFGLLKNINAQFCVMLWFFVGKRFHLQLEIKATNEFSWGISMHNGRQGADKNALCLAQAISSRRERFVHDCKRH
jgi:hypothetical protein